MKLFGLGAGSGEGKSHSPLNLLKAEKRLCYPYTLVLQQGHGDFYG